MIELKVETAELKFSVSAATSCCFFIRSTMVCSKFAVISEAAASFSSKAVAAASASSCATFANASMASAEDSAFCFASTNAALSLSVHSGVGLVVTASA